MGPDPFPWHRSQLVHHQPARSPQPSPRIGWNRQPEYRRRRRIGRQGTHDNRLVRVEPVVLNDDGGTGLASVGGTTSDGPDLTPPHSASHAEIASTNAWSSFA